MVMTRLLAPISNSSKNDLRLNMFNVPVKISSYFPPLHRMHVIGFWESIPHLQHYTSADTFLENPHAHTTTILTIAEPPPRQRHSIPYAYAARLQTSAVDSYQVVHAKHRQIGC